VQADAAGINGATDAGLTPFPPATLVEAIPADRLFTVAEISALLKIRRSDVYGACDRGHLRYVKFEGAVQVEGRDLKAYLDLGELAPIPWTPGLCRQLSAAPVGFGFVRAPVLVA
jgi:hypothetical protein